MSNQKNWLDEEIQVPESLLPENIEKKLNEEKAKQDKKRRAHRTAIVSTAASFIVVAGVVTGATVFNHMAGNNGDSYRSKKHVSHEVGSHDKFFHAASNMEELKRYVRTNYNGMYHGGSTGETNEDLSEGTNLPNNNSATTEDSSNGGHAYSGTNVQTQGIDEADIVKTDGDYIYHLSDRNYIEIIHVVDGTFQVVYTLNTNDFNGNYPANMYLDTSRHLLTTITYNYDYYSDDEVLTTIFVYDVSDPLNPSQRDCFTQSGWYHDSRYVNGTLYLYTTSMDFRQNIENGKLPEVDGTMVQCNDVYLSAYEPDSEFIISAVSLSNDGQLTAGDSAVLLIPYGEVYMGLDHFYIYFSNYDYEKAEEHVNISKFGYHENQFIELTTTTLDGHIPDTFAIHEDSDYLYVLTGSASNDLHVLDDSMNEVGSIHDIAPGENIYAARYIGKKAYFITYRQVDPLFVADLSDPTNPVLLGEVEIEGFSEYLHPFGENLILGIGYDAYDTEYGSTVREGIKLVMFDVSDPLNPKVLDCLYVGSGTESCATWNYKAVLADPSTGLIGLPIINYDADSDDATHYMAFQWNGTQFSTVMDTIFDNYWDNDIRGLYIDQYLYVVSDNRLQSFDMLNGFAPVDCLISTDDIIYRVIE